MQSSPTAPVHIREIPDLFDPYSLDTEKGVIFIPGYSFFQDKKNYTYSDHTLCYDCRI